MTQKVNSNVYDLKQVRERFLKYISETVDYWHARREQSEIERMNGLVFSILSLLDGCAVDMPGFLVVPNPHPDDKEWHEDHGEDWFPESAEFNGTDISGELHEHWYDVRKDKCLTSYHLPPKKHLLRKE